MRDATTEIFAAVRALLTTDPALFALIGDKVLSDPGNSPEPPFIRMQIAIAVPWESDCGDGAEHDLHLHIYTRENGGTQCAEIADRVVKVLDDAGLALPTSNVWWVHWTGSIPRTDPNDPTLQTTRLAFDVTTTDME